MPKHDPSVTRALIDAARGDQGAADRLWSLVYDELRAIAHRELYGEERGQTLSTTVLVNEAYLKLIDVDRVAWRDRAHFFAVACRGMRQVLVDRARHRMARKRSGRRHEVTLTTALRMAEEASQELIELDEALTELAAHQERLAKVVELRFFGGLSVPETAEVMGTSARTVERDWRRAKAYLMRLLTPAGPDGAPADP